MSPGINDPGTAVNGIDYLTELFYLRLQKNDKSIIEREGIPYIHVNTVDSIKNERDLQLIAKLSNGLNIYIQ